MSVAQNTEQKTGSHSHSWFSASAVSSKPVTEDTLTVDRHVSESMRNIVRLLEAASTSNRSLTIFDDTNNTEKKETVDLARTTRLEVMKVLCEHPDAAQTLLRQSPAVNATTVADQSPSVDTTSPSFGR